LQDKREKIPFSFLAVRYRPVTNFGHQEGRRVFLEGTEFFELCPIVSKYIKQIFPGGGRTIS